MSFSFKIKNPSSGPSKGGQSSESSISGASHVSSLFKESLEAEEERAAAEAAALSKKPSLDIFTKETDKIQQKKQQQLLEENPSVLSYDEVYDDFSSADAQEMQRRAQTRRVYLGYVADIKDKIASDGRTADQLAADAAASASPQQASHPQRARFIEKLISTSRRRQIEREIIAERQLQKEREASGEANGEVFVTAAYKARLEERQRVAEELEQQEKRDNAQAPEKKKDLSSFHAYLLKSGAASRHTSLINTPAKQRCQLDGADAVDCKEESDAQHGLVKEEKVDAASTEQAPQGGERNSSLSPHGEASNKDLPASPKSPNSLASLKAENSTGKRKALGQTESENPPTAVPPKLSTDAIAAARARFLQRKKVKQ